MPLPRWVARFNKRATNRFMEPLARRFSNFAIVHHSGRTSSRPYTTPVNFFPAGDGIVIVALTYGSAADWVQNTLAIPGSLEFDKRLWPIRELTIVGRDEAWSYVPHLVRAALRVLRVRHFARLVYFRPDVVEHNTSL